MIRGRIGILPEQRPELRQGAIDVAHRDLSVEYRGRRADRHTLVKLRSLWPDRRGSEPQRDLRVVLIGLRLRKPRPVDRLGQIDLQHEASPVSLLLILERLQEAGGPADRALDHEPEAQRDRVELVLAPIPISVAEHARARGAQPLNDAYRLFGRDLNKTPNHDKRER